MGSSLPYGSALWKNINIVWSCTWHNYSLYNEGFISICLKCSHDRIYVKVIYIDVLRYELETSYCSLLHAVLFENCF